MSSDPLTDSQSNADSLATHLHSLGSRTAVAIRGALSRRDGRAIALAATVAYYTLFAYAQGNLGGGDGSWDAVVVADPLSRMLQPMGPFQFEPIALLSLGPMNYLFSPLTAAIGLSLAALVGLNLAVSWVVWRGPSACRVNPGVGMLAGAPALLSGFACCGPTVLLVLGLQASAGLIAVFQWLVPLAFVSLVGTLLWVGRHVRTGDIPAAHESSG